MKTFVLICTGGLSTTWLEKKLMDFSQSHDLDLDIKACGLSEYPELAKDADYVILGPQIGYYQKEVSETLGRTVNAISPNDYALANCEAILTLAGIPFSES